MNTLEQIAETIEREGLLRPEQKVIAAVSGGADSLCLAWILRELGYQLVIAHLDHGLRPESRQEAEFVQAMAERWGVSVHVEQADPPAAPLSSQEAWARQVRYQFLLRVATDTGVGVVATGHTADDQVETILMNLIRGAGPDGLAGMPFAGPLPLPAAQEADQPVLLIRPLLELWRHQTESCCHQAGLTPIMDASNLDFAFTRNRIRHELVPTLEKYNPAIKETLVRTGEVMQFVSDWLNSQVDQAWPKAVRQAEAGSLWLQTNFFREAQPVLGLSVLRRAFQTLSDPASQLSMEQSKAALAAIIEADSGTRLSLPGNLVLEIHRGRALLSPEPAAVMRKQAPQISRQQAVALDGVTDLDRGWQLRTEIIVDGWNINRQVRAAAPPYDDPALEVIALPGDLDTLILRPPGKGEIFQPFGMTGSMKLSDFFINQGVPQVQRHQWPLLVQGDVILWVVGLRLSELARLSKGVDSLLLLELIRPSGLSGS